MDWMRASQEDDYLLMPSMQVGNIADLTQMLTKQTEEFAPIVNCFQRLRHSQTLDLGPYAEDIQP